MEEIELRELRYFIAVAEEVPAAPLRQRLHSFVHALLPAGSQS